MMLVLATQIGTQFQAEFTKPNGTKRIKLLTADEVMKWRKTNPEIPPKDPDEAAVLTEVPLYDTQHGTLEPGHVVDQVAWADIVMADNQIWELDVSQFVGTLPNITLVLPSLDTPWGVVTIINGELLVNGAR